MVVKASKDLGRRLQSEIRDIKVMSYFFSGLFFISLQK